MDSSDSLQRQSLPGLVETLPNGFNRQKTYVERSQVCFNSCIGCLYIFFCMPCYCCWLNRKCAQT